MKRCARVLAALTLSAALASAAGAMTYEVTIQDLILGGPDTGQPFSPPVAVVHNSGYSQFEPGMMASPGLELVAREGNPSVLEGEALADPNVYSVVVGTGPYFDMQTIMVAGNPGDLFSVAWMLGRTNDLFSGLHDVALPAVGSVEFDTEVWDSGTEENTGLAADIPFYGGHNVGPDEDSPIMTISAYTVHDDPNHGTIMWSFPPSAHVTIRVLDGTPTAETTWGAVKSLYR
jgi:hypothetical protein